MTGADDRHGATDDPDEPRRRFRRRLDRIDAVAGDPEALAAVHAELVLLREENARLKAAQHQRVDISRLLGRARSLSSSEGDRDNVGDDTEQLLVEGLVIRESLLEICQEIERAMVAFEAKLSALASVGAVRQEPRPIRDDEKVNGHGARTA